VAREPCGKDLCFKSMKDYFFQILAANSTLLQKAISAEKISGVMFNLNSKGKIAFSVDSRYCFDT